MNRKKKVSIIIRTKNEERRITACLAGVFDQEYKDFEVILVDNESTDRTVEKAKQFNPAKIITCRHYLPGKALNMGIRETNADYVVSLSGHCIPVDNKWLGKLIENFSDPEVAGVYGRQEAMSFTSDSDKRDLALVFGLDRKVQKKDSFFHNANSMFRRDIWEKMPFDEKITNIEDRAWAQHVLQKGYKIIYEPEASVYHHHGIHQNGDKERCKNVARILEHIHDDYEYKSIDMEKLDVVAFVPVRGPVKRLKNKPLLYYTVKRALEARYIKRVIVSTDDARLADIALKLGAQVPFIRDRALSGENVDLGRVLQYSLARAEEKRIFPDVCLSLEVTFPFRPKGLLDDMILQLARHDYDSVVAARPENKSIWKRDSGKIVQLDEDMTPRKFKEPSFLGFKGIGCVTYPEIIREGKLLGENIGIYDITDPYSQIEVRGEREFELASFLTDKYFPEKK